MSAAPANVKPRVIAPTHRHLARGMRLSNHVHGMGGFPLPSHRMCFRFLWSFDTGSTRERSTPTLAVRLAIHNTCTQPISALDHKLCGY
jgi:hypothetical protein